MKNWEKANENEEEMMSNNEESGNTVDVKEGMDWHEKHVLALQRICSLEDELACTKLLLRKRTFSVESCSDIKFYTGFTSMTMFQVVWN